MPGDHRPKLDEVQQAMREQRSLMAELSFEQRRVEFLVNLFKFYSAKREMIRLALARTGQPLIGFAEWRELFPTFPIHLGASRLAGVKLHEHPDASLPALFTRFRKAPFVAAYEEFYEQATAEARGPVGLVFPRNRIVQGLVIHNGMHEAYRVVGSTLVYQGESEQSLFVQPFGPLMEAIKRSGWRPGR